MFSNFTAVDGTPSWDALLEMSCVFQALSYNQRATAETTIAACGGGQILLWEYLTGSYPPSVAMVRQGNVLILYVTGTENLAQLYGNVIGAFGGQYGTFGCMTHNFFHTSWVNVKRRIMQSLPTDWRNCELRFFGHSLGAAIAFLGAVEWKRDNPSQAVHYLATAAPKSLTIGYNSWLPNTCNMVASPDDVVPLVPSNGMNTAIHYLTTAIFLSIPRDWLHYGGLWLIRGGNLPLQRANADDFNRTPNPIILATTAVDHFFKQYLRKVLLGWSRFVGSGQNVSLVPIANKLGDDPVTQNLVTNINAWNAIDVPAANLSEFKSEGPGPLTRENLMQAMSVSGGLTGVTRGDNFMPAMSVSGDLTDVTRGDAIFTGLSLGGNMSSKVTIFMQDGAGSFTESYFRSGLDPAAVTPAMILQLTDARVKLGGSEFEIVKVRVSTVDNARAVMLWYRPALVDIAGGVHRWTGSAGGEGRFENSALADFSGTALLCRKQSGLKFSRLFLRGIPDDIVQAGGRYRTFSMPLFPINLKAFAQVLASGWSWRGVADVQPVAQQLTAAVTGFDGLTLMTVGGNLFAGKAPGTKLVVRVSGQRQPGNLNGNWTVSVVSDTQCRTVRPLSVNNFTASNGRVRYTNMTYLPITDLKPERIVSKRAGRPTDQSRGRARNIVRG